jgi:hypothetical protein
MKKRESVENVVRARLILETLSLHYQSPDYKQLIQNMNEYVKNNCYHSFVEDYVDVDPERSQRIRYCEICYSNSEEN